MNRMTNPSIIKTWQQRPLIISGPCSAESEQQLVETAMALASTGKVAMLRAGIWKPRTKPGLFEGMGSIALQWLKLASSLSGLPTCVEVANAKHVEEALHMGVDVLWIGARTTVNPFSVQEIADVLRNTDVPILVKNPVNPDIELWAGAIERLQAVHVKNIGMIHRGFSTYGDSNYRNAPLWHIPIEMKRRYPEMLLICDPSHICGNRHMLHQVAQRSIDLGYHGLMVESHPNPDKALSDAKQQILPGDLMVMLNNLVWRSEQSSEQEFVDALTKLRARIDNLDEELLGLIAERMKLAEKIGEYKRDNNITILQTQRWNEILEKSIQKGIKLGLSPAFIARYFDAVHLESISRQNSVMYAKKEETK